MRVNLVATLNSPPVSKAKGLKSLALKGTFLLGYGGGHFYWALTFPSIDMAKPEGLLLR